MCISLKLYLPKAVAAKFQIPQILHSVCIAKMHLALPCEKTCQPDIEPAANQN